MKCACSKCTEQVEETDWTYPHCPQCYANIDDKCNSNDEIIRERDEARAELDRREAELLSVIEEVRRERDELRKGQYCQICGRILDIENVVWLSREDADAIETKIDGVLNKGWSLSALRDALARLRAARERTK